MSFELANLLTVFFTLSIFSLLYKENPFSIFAEHTFVGTAQAFALVVAIGFIMDYAITPIMSGNYLAIIPILLGLSTYLRFSNNYRWVARYPIALSLGIGMGVTLRSTVETSISNQIKATLVPLWTGDISTSLGNILLVAAVITSILYFYFSRPHEGALGGTSKVGYYLIYVALGAYFGNTVMGRVSLVSARVTELLSTDNTYATIILTVVILGTIVFLSSKKLLKKATGYE